MQATEEKPISGGAEAVRSLSSTRTVATSAMWNLIGRAGPLVVAVLATPWLVRDLGPDRWGVFTIALSFVGIFSIFDFGIGRALTRTIAELLVEQRREEAAVLARTGITTLAVLGCAGGVLIAAIVGFWVRHGLHIPPELQQQVLRSFYVLCFAAPLVIVSAALWGVIAAFQEFRSANLINVPIMAMYYLGPLMALHFINSLVPVLAVLVLCRIVMVTAYWRICVRVLPELRTARVAFSKLGPVLRMGGWMTASNVTFPILTYVDRFIIASVLSAAATGYYSTPFDLVMRFTLVPVAIMNTAYPAIAASYRADPEQAASLFRRSLLTVTAVLFPACLLCVAFSHWVLTIWLGAEFASHATVVLRWLGVGILLSCVDSVVGGLLDGIGKASVNAKFSMVELILYIPLMAFLVRAYGIEGAAIASALRCLFDLGVRFWFAQHLYKPIRGIALSMLPVLSGAAATLILTALLQSTAWLPLAAGAGSLLLAVLLWRALTHTERSRLSATAGRFLPLAHSAGR